MLYHKIFYILRKSPPIFSASRPTDGAGGDRAEEQTRTGGGPPARLFFSRTALKQRLKSVVLSVIQEDTDYTLDEKVSVDFVRVAEYTGITYCEYPPSLPRGKNNMRGGGVVGVE